jgi:guanylate kinase
VLLEIDWQGARQVRSKVPDAVSVFILPPSRPALEQRMRRPRPGQRGSDRQRLAAAREEMSHYIEFDYVIVNEHFNYRRRRDVRDLHRQPGCAARPRWPGHSRLIRSCWRTVGGRARGLDPR